jgi:hypothetical protein
VVVEGPSEVLGALKLEVAEGIFASLCFHAFEFEKMDNSEVDAAYWVTVVI